MTTDATARALLDRVRRLTRDQPMWVGTGTAVNELAEAYETALDRVRDLEAALSDATSALRYIRETHGDLYGVGWDRVLAPPALKPIEVLAPRRQEPTP